MSTALADARLKAKAIGDCTAIIALLPYAQWLGVEMRLLSTEPQFNLPFKPLLMGNPTLPAIHGGVTATFMETAAILHLGFILDETRMPKSIDFSVDYLRSAACVESFAACTVTRLGRRVAQVQIRCWQEDSERPVAVARAHFLLTADVE